MENIMRISVDTAIHIPTGFRLSSHAMAALMSKSEGCLYTLNDNMFIICDADTFHSLESNTYHVTCVEYDDHVYEHDSICSYKENVVLQPSFLWDEYTEWVEEAI